MRKVVALIIIILSFFAIIGVLTTLDDGLAVERGYWSKVEYTESLLAGYPDYYPLILKLSSLGPLPPDLQSEVNYTDTIKIAYYNIHFNISDSTEFKTIDRQRSSDEWIGSKKPLELEFEIDKEIAQKYTGLEITIEMAPHNFTDYLNNDIFIIEVEFRREGTGNDILFAFSITFLPLMFVYVNIKFYYHINSKFIRNIRWKDIPRYYFVYMMNIMYGHKKMIIVSITLLSLIYSILDII